MRKYILAIICLFIAFNNILAQNCCISNIYVSGNKVTKDNIIYRELPFSVGNVFTVSELEDKIRIATENLNNMSLFNFVSITYEKDSLNCIIEDQLISSKVIDKEYSCNVSKNKQSYNIKIKVDERWYYWPHLSLIFEDRNMSSWLHNMDFKRITLGVGVIAENFLGLNNKISLYTTMGFEKGINFSYNNIALDKDRKHYIGIELKYNLNRTSNYASSNNKPDYAKSNSKYMERALIGRINYTYRPHIRTKHTINLVYNTSQINDTLLLLNPNYWGTYLNISHGITLKYTYSYEQRDLVIYPTKGYYFRASAETFKALNYKFFNTKISGNYQYYLPLSKRWFYNIDLKLGLSFKTNEAYVYDKAIGYEDVNIKGYELYIIDGQHYATLSNSIRFLILPKKTVTINWLNWLSKFNKIHFTIYGRGIVDMGYAYNNNPQATNSYANTFLLGTGLGFDILTYYDIILSAGYVVNKSGHNNFIFSIKTPLF